MDKYFMCNILSGAAARTLLVKKKMTIIQNNSVVDEGVEKNSGKYTCRIKYENRIWESYKQEDEKPLSIYENYQNLCY